MVESSAACACDIVSDFLTTHTHIPYTATCPYSIIRRRGCGSRGIYTVPKHGLGFAMSATHRINHGSLEYKRWLQGWTLLLEPYHLQCIESNLRHAEASAIHSGPVKAVGHYVKISKSDIMRAAL